MFTPYGSRTMQTAWKDELDTFKDYVHNPSDIKAIQVFWIRHGVWSVRVTQRAEDKKAIWTALRKLDPGDIPEAGTFRDLWRGGGNELVILLQQRRKGDLESIDFIRISWDRDTDFTRVVRECWKHGREQTRTRAGP